MSMYVYFHMCMCMCICIMYVYIQRLEHENMVEWHFWKLRKHGGHFVLNIMIFSATWHDAGTIAAADACHVRSPLST